MAQNVPRLETMNRSATAARLERRSALPILLLLAMEIGAMAIGAEEAGLSKGAANPADLGHRCAVMAGRDDRAYLHCADEARRRMAPADGTRGTPSDGLRPEHSDSSRDGVTRRYPLRGR